MGTEDSGKAALIAAELEEAQHRLDLATADVQRLTTQLNKHDPLICRHYPDQPCPLHNLHCQAPKCKVRRSTLPGDAA